MTTNKRLFSFEEKKGYQIPRMAKHAVKAKKPMIWMGLRPHLSTKKTVKKYPGTFPHRAITRERISEGHFKIHTQLAKTGRVNIMIRR